MLNSKILVILPDFDVGTMCQIGNIELYRDLYLKFVV
jgi:hypothetical protein